MNGDGFVEIGNRIRIAREQKGWSGTKLATLLGYARPHLVWWRVETGRRSLNCIQLGVVAKALGVTTDWLIYGKRSDRRRASPAKRAA